MNAVLAANPFSNVFILQLLTRLLQAQLSCPLLSSSLLLLVFTALAFTASLDRESPDL